MNIQKKLPHILDADEVEAIKRQPNCRCATGLRNRVMLELMHGAGFRVSEVVKLERGDIAWEKGIVEVRGGKGGKDRPVPIGPALVAWLRAWDSHRPRAKKFFTTLRAEPLSTRYIRQFVKRLACKAGIEHAERVHPHTFRHTVATEMLDEGFSIREVQEFLGHANVKTTEIYTHVRPKGLATKIQKRAQPSYPGR